MPRVKGSGLPVSERFWPKVRRIDDADSCWEWTAAKKESGYGVISLGGRGTKLVRAHRFAYEQEHGPIPDDMVLCHRCDNPGCVRPSHMFVGTHADNVRDMLDKDRECRGERCPWAKLTESQVQGVRARVRSGETCAVVAQDLGVSRSLISAICRGERWKKSA